MRTIEDFSEVVVCDFEYHHAGQSEGPPTIPLCACAQELRSEREYRLWAEDLQRPEPPWAQGRDVLFVCYSAPAELNCFLSLNWPLPPFILDLLIEHRLLVNGVLPKEHPRDLLSAMRFHGLLGIEPSAKEEYRDLILTGGPFSSDQRTNILTYCASDVSATKELLKVMLKRMSRDLNPALFRGRYTIPVTLMMRTGIPVDETLWRRLLEHRDGILQEVVADCPVYEGTTFKFDRFAQWLDNHDLLDRWPRTESDHLSTDDKTFRKFSRAPPVEALRKVRQVVDQFRKPSFTVRGGRNHYQSCRSRPKLLATRLYGVFFKLLLGYEV
jgi:hypothetical protein